jgi:hypothetical protein
LISGDKLLKVVIERQAARLRARRQALFYFGIEMQRYVHCGLSIPEYRMYGCLNRHRLKACATERAAYRIKFMTTLAVSLLFAFTLHAADRVTATGSVIDQSSNQPIENATVWSTQPASRKAMTSFVPPVMSTVGNEPSPMRRGLSVFPVWARTSCSLFSLSAKATGRNSSRRWTPQMAPPQPLRSRSGLLLKTRRRLCEAGS